MSTTAQEEGGRPATKADCAGCRDDFYNHGHGAALASGSGGECWLLKDARIVKRYRTHRDAMPASKGAFTEVHVPSCKNGNGWYYVRTLPDFVKASDVVRARKAPR